MLIRYLDTDVKLQMHLNKLPCDPNVRDVWLGRASKQSTNSHIDRAVVRRLDRLGRVGGWEVTEKCNRRDFQATVQFQNFEDAQAAILGLDGNDLREAGMSELRIKHDVTLQL